MPKMNKKIDTNGVDSVENNSENIEKKEINIVCGIVMPISSTINCTEKHWNDVISIIRESIKKSGFESRLVSDASDVGIIQKRIIQNLYENPIVVCDVSEKNPNVMFELGIRLAFDKPTIIIKDDHTDYSFDTSAIEHIEYPRDLRYNKINHFKETLSEKISATYNKSQHDENYTTFLKHFGEFKVAKIDKKELPVQDFILEELASIKYILKNQKMALTKTTESTIRDFNRVSSNKEDGGEDYDLRFIVPANNIEEVNNNVSNIASKFGNKIKDINAEVIGKNIYGINVKSNELNPITKQNLIIEFGNNVVLKKSLNGKITVFLKNSL